MVRHAGVFLLAHSQYGTLLKAGLSVGDSTKFCKINHIVHMQAVMPFRLLARVAQILPQIGYSGYAPQISGINVIPTHKCRTLEDGEG